MYCSRITKQPDFDFQQHNSDISSSAQSGYLLIVSSSGEETDVFAGYFLF